MGSEAPLKWWISGKGDHWADARKGQDNRSRHSQIFRFKGFIAQTVKDTEMKGPFVWQKFAKEKPGEVAENRKQADLPQRLCHNTLAKQQ